MTDRDTYGDVDVDVDMIRMSIAIYARTKCSDLYERLCTGAMDVSVDGPAPRAIRTIRLGCVLKILLSESSSETTT